MKVGCLNNISEVGLNQFTTKYQISNDVVQSDLILVRSYNMHEFDVPANLIGVARAGAGVNNIPLQDYADKGIVVFNTPGANANGVKELVLAGMLLASRDIVGGIEWVKNNKEDNEISKTVEKAKKAFGGTEILGKTISVIGMGAVGGRVANACFDLGMKVYGYDPYISEAAMKQLNPGVTLSNQLDHLYEVSDFISLHLPLLESTKYFFNKETFEKVKPGLVLLNYSRDLLVDDFALEEALASRKVKTYVTDFPNHFVANLEHVIPIPHLGASTEESEDNCAIMAAQQLMRFNERGDIVNSVNYPNVILGEIAGKSRLILLVKDIDHITEKIDKAVRPFESLVETTVSKFKGDYGVFAFDLKENAPDDLLKELKNIGGITRIRTI